MGFRSICIESRCKCSYMGGYIVVTTTEATTKIHLSEISSILFSTAQSYVSTRLLSELAKAKIPVTFCDEKSFPIAESLPLHGAHNCLEAVEAQLEWTLPSKKRMWQRVVRDKIIAQSEVLHIQGKHEDEKVLIGYASEVRSGDPTNREAAAASRYFSSLFGVGFNRDLDIPINAALNYGYSVLLSKVSREIVSRGRLTQYGIGHHGVFNQWNFACDLMEPFRPFVDEIVINSGLEGFNTAMKRLLVDMMNRTVSYKDGNYKMASVISLYIKDCLDVLDKKIAPDDMTSYSLL